ncbi:MAG: hypothetical protein WBG53_11455 [Rhodococcus sp. (in: high G+C Gram-positive bacteria)]|uniref:hypothetical protein n=1 Tax=unclassified Rhodococcus (in: high G+C Gram-positive bacteria) TaxID=192944 RepID=UPI000EF884D8|nr:MULTISPECIES: hypothetical protein [unclassified Rhodococcus (in: high G+C Gram-positive bacteria)]RMB78117.1 hypothetical protein AYK61_18385 [Rhodococcus sp. SBT000017]
MDALVTSREEAETALRQGGWASVSTGLRWFRSNAEGERDFLLVAEQLRYPDMGPMGIAAETLVLRFGVRGLCEVIGYLISDDLEFNAHEYLLGTLEDLYLEEDVPVRDMLVSMTADDRYIDLRPTIVEMLENPNMAADMQGALRTP